MMGENVARNM